MSAIVRGCFLPIGDGGGGVVLGDWPALLRSEDAPDGEEVSSLRGVRREEGSESGERGEGGKGVEREGFGGGGWSSGWKGGTVGWTADGGGAGSDGGAENNKGRLDWE